MRVHLSVALVSFLLLAGCSVNVRKNGNGEDKDVAIHTPFGGLQVRAGQDGKAVDTGLPVYPGARVAPSEDKKEGKSDSDSVDMHMGFGPYQIRVQVASYVSGDPQDEVVAYYRKKLGGDGDVLTCRGHQPVGEPKRTAQGLTCSDEGGSKGVNVGDRGDLELKAGSPHRQQIVAFSEKHPGTHFALIALTLPETHDESAADAQ